MLSISTIDHNCVFSRSSKSFSTVCRDSKMCVGLEATKISNSQQQQTGLFERKNWILPWNFHLKCWEIYIYIIYIYRKSIFFRGSKHPFAHLAAWDKHGHHIYATSSGKLGAGRRKPGTGRSLDRRSCKKGWVQRGLNSLCFWYDFCVQES